MPTWKRCVESVGFNSYKSSNLILISGSMYIRRYFKPGNFFQLIFGTGGRVARWFIFKPKIPIWVNFGRALAWKILIIFLTIWYILQTFGIFYDHLVHFVFFWYIFSGLGIMYKEKSGNPDRWVWA
jgi:hypothetical protein